MKLKAKKNCKFCLGSGMTFSLTNTENLCLCVVEEHEIIVCEKDFNIKERHTPKTLKELNWRLE